MICTQWMQVKCTRRLNRSIPTLDKGNTASQVELALGKLLLYNKAKLNDVLENKHRMTYTTRPARYLTLGGGRWLRIMKGHL